MTASATRSAREATEALIRFAAGTDSDSGAQVSVPLDDADATEAGLAAALVASPSAGSAGGAPGTLAEAAWWDAGRGGIRLVGRQMAGMSLRGADFSRADMGGADLTGIKGAGVCLAEARLEGTDLSGADLIGAVLTGASAGEADFSGALLEDADLHGAHLRFAKFADTIMDGANLSDADLWGAHFDRVAAERADFKRSRLDESRLMEADLSFADFSGSSLRKADLTGAKLRGAVLREAVLDGANLSGADLREAVMPNISLSACTLIHARFAGAWLERTRMRAMQLGGGVGEELAHDLDGALDSYIVLERNFLSLGSTEDASWAYRRRRRVGKLLHRRQSVAALKRRSWPAATVAGAQWLGDASAEWLCDYGESVGRVVRAFFSILLLFALLYWGTGSLVPREGFAVARHSYAVVNYLLFSLDSMTTVGTSEVALRPGGELGMLLSSLQTVVGTILLGLFGFVLGARIRN